MPTSSAPHLRKHRFHPDSKTCKKTSQPGGKGAGSKSRPRLEIATHEPAYIWLLPSSLLTADDIRFQPRHKTSRRDPHRPRPGRAGLSEITLSPQGLGRKKKNISWQPGGGLLLPARRSQRFKCRGAFPRHEPRAPPSLPPFPPL